MALRWCLIHGNDTPDDWGARDRPAGSWREGTFVDHGVHASAPSSGLSVGGPGTPAARNTARNDATASRQPVLPHWHGTSSWPGGSDVPDIPGRPIETEGEIEQDPAAVPSGVLGAPFDIGHLAWTASTRP